MSWAEVVDLYNEVLDLEPSERDRRLADPDLEPGIVSEVRSLLATETGSESLIDKPVGDLAGRSGGQNASTSDPEQIGPYRVLRRIGAGGMGVILLAERADGSFKKRVAIKLIKRGMDSEAVVARFQAEREILASLEHPAIARLIDGGLTEDGRPYFVLEHVDGALPIDVYSRRNDLSLERRIQLFRSVCEAVHSAHQQLVLHRDLKPSNLLVDRSGQLKLVDFGIAKLMTPDGLDATRTVHRMMTPAYAAPEQLEGRAVGTYSDVYSLGVVLFELLTGSRPSGPDETTPRPGPTRPSAVLATADTGARKAWPARDLDSIGSRLSGDLDAIVLQCLQPEAELRYSSARALADDVGRFLDGRPVLARPPSVGYQLRKLIARNPVASGLGAVALLTLLVGSTVIAWQSQRVERERDRATAEAEKATQVSEALIGLFDMSDPALAADAKEVRLREVLERTEAGLAVGLENQPAVQAKMLTVLGRINTEMARYEIADEQLTAASATLVSLFPQGHPDRVEALRVLSRLRGFQQRTEEALSLAGEAVAMQRALGGEEAELANALVRFAKINMNTGRLDPAEASLKEALELRRDLLGVDHDAVGQVIGVLAFVAYYRGHYSEAVALAKDAVAIRSQALGAVHQGVGNELENLGLFLIAAGERGRAREALNEAREVRLAVFGPEHPYVAFSSIGLGRLAQIEGDLEGALEWLETAHDLRQATYSQANRMVQESAAHLADVLREMGRVEEAVALLGPVVEASARGLDAAHPPNRYLMLESYGRALLAVGRTQEAEDALQQAVALIEHWRGPEHDWTIRGRVSHARALWALGRVDEAEAQNDSSLIALRALDLPSLGLAESLALRAEIHESRGDLDAARAAWEERVDFLTREFGPASPRVARARADLAG